MRIKQNTNFFNCLIKDYNKVYKLDGYYNI